MNYLTFACIKISIIGVDDLSNEMSKIFEQKGHKVLKANLLPKRNDF